ncbi:proline-rich protein 33 [Dromaius novaehollandiae]|uniref:proline-rich protein 33 n=1 Tax=Dromaius novaehollandiae TaxID=8790 RepID=UPI0031204348
MRTKGLLLQHLKRAALNPLQHSYLPRSAGSPGQAPRPAPHEESVKAPYPKPSTSDAHSDKPATLGSDTEVSGSERASESPKQRSETQRPSTPGTPWRQVPAEAAAPAQVSAPGAIPTETKAEHAIPPQPTPSLPDTSPPLKAEPTLQSVEETKPPGASVGGWYRLRKRLVVQPEAPSFPEPEPAKQGQEEASHGRDSSPASTSQDSQLVKPRATRMWDAILYQMTVRKKQQAEEKRVQKEEGSSFPRRLPILLHKPRFDARKLKELAAKPMTKITTMFEVGRYRPKVTEEHTKSFSRMASGWSVN